MIATPNNIKVGLILLEIRHKEAQTSKWMNTKRRIDRSTDKGERIFSLIDSWTDNLMNQTRQLYKIVNQLDPII